MEKKRMAMVWLAMILFSFCLTEMAAEKRKAAGAGRGPDPHRIQFQFERAGGRDHQKEEIKKSEPLVQKPYVATTAATILTIDGPVVAGVIDPAYDVDAYQFTVTTLGNYAIRTLAGPLGDSMDTVISLYGPDDPNIFIADDDDGGPRTLSMLGLQLQAGTYYLNVGGYSSHTGNYSVQVVTAGEISGQVTDPASVGIFDLQVNFFDSDYNDMGNSYTDGAGNYTVLLPPGSYKVEFHPDSGQPYAIEWYNNKSNFEDADTVTVTAGNTTTVNAQLAASGYITGRVTDHSGSGIEDINLNVYTSVDYDYVTYSHTDASGNYSVANLSAGSYKLEFNDYHSPGFADEWYNNQSGFTTANPVVVASGGTTSNINAQLAGCRANDYDDLVATYATQGVYSRSSETGKFYKMATPATVIAVADLDNDCIDDLIGIWPSQAGVWVKYSKTGTWAKLASTAKHITTGDMNGDGAKELLGTWDGQGVYWRDNTSGVWTKLATPATLITAGDIDWDGTADLIGIWPSQGGVWVKLSSGGAWKKLSSTARDIAVGDVNGSGHNQEFFATYDGQGVFWLEYSSGTWTKMATPATQVTCGDLDGDSGVPDDLIGIWPAQSGVWVKYQDTGTWKLLSSTATDIVAGKMRQIGSILSFSEALDSPASGDSTGFGPSNSAYIQDMSAGGPGGVNFVCRESANLEPVEQIGGQRLPGPGEPGFCYLEGENLEPQAKDTPKEKPEQKNR